MAERRDSFSAPTIPVALPPFDQPGILSLPESARGLVLFAHGSGSSRMSPRNQRVAADLNDAGYGTLLFDLLTPEEAADRTLVFDIPLLAERLLQATHWARREEATKDLPIGYFGASTGGGAAIAAAASPYAKIAAVVSRGGRPDLAFDALAEAKAPTRLIVGGADSQVLELNEQALAQMRCERDLKVVPGAGHLFEEPGAMDEVVALAREWFDLHMAKGERHVR